MCLLDYINARTYANLFLRVGREIDTIYYTTIYYATLQKKLNSEIGSALDFNFERLRVRVPLRDWGDANSRFL